MTGLLVVGLRHGAGEGSVAAALAAVLRRTGTSAHARKLFQYDVVASPVIAARHAGDAIDVAAVAADIRADDADDAVVLAAPGGLLAALTARATLRDLAGDLRLPLVLAARAEPDATNLVRLSLAAARSARLTVAAVVLTGWPETPSPVQTDERKLLGELAGVTVLTLSESPSARADDVRDWPVDAWLHAVPDEPEPTPAAPRGSAVPAGGGPAAAGATPARVLAAGGHVPAPPAPGDLGLEPFAGWPARETGDPRTTPRPRMMEALLEIVAAEGPIRASRAYALYNRASGGKKLTNAARTPLQGSLRWLAQEGKLVLIEPPGQDDAIVRTPDQPAIRLREIGDRTLEEVPLAEIGALMDRLRAGGRHYGNDQLKRAVLSTYGLVRLTQRADDYLNHALAGVNDPARNADED